MAHAIPRHELRAIFDAVNARINASDPLLDIVEATLDVLDERGALAVYDDSTQEED